MNTFIASYAARIIFPHCQCLSLNRVCGAYSAVFSPSYRGSALHRHARILPSYCLPFLPMTREEPGNKIERYKTSRSSAGIFEAFTAFLRKPLIHGLPCSEHQGFLHKGNLAGCFFDFLAFTLFMGPGEGLFQSADILAEFIFSEGTK